MNFRIIAICLLVISVFIWACGKAPTSSIPCLLKTAEIEIGEVFNADEGQKVETKQGISGEPGETLIVYKGAAISIDANHRIVKVMISSPESSSNAGLSPLMLTLPDGRDFFSLSPKDIIQIYGKPSEEIAIEEPEPGSKGVVPSTYIYDYVANDSSVFVYTVLFVPASGNQLKVDMIWGEQITKGWRLKGITDNPKNKLYKMPAV